MSDPEPIRLSFTLGGLIALWASTRNLPVTRADIEALCQALGHTYDSKVEPRPQSPQA